MPNGYFISNGPGDPAAMPYAIDTVKELLKEEQTFVWYLSWLTNYWRWQMIFRHLKCIMGTEV